MTDYDVTYIHGLINTYYLVRSGYGTGKRVKRKVAYTKRIQT